MYLKRLIYDFHAPPIPRVGVRLELWTFVWRSLRVRSLTPRLIQQSWFLGFVKNAQERRERSTLMGWYYKPPKQLQVLSWNYWCEFIRLLYALLKTNDTIASKIQLSSLHTLKQKFRRKARINKWVFFTTLIDYYTYLAIEEDINTRENFRYYIVKNLKVYGGIPISTWGFGIWGYFIQHSY